MTEQTQDRTEAMLAPFHPLRAELARLVEENAAKTFDLTTSTGEKACRSHIYALRLKKGEIDRVRKATKEDALRFGRRVEEVAKELTAAVDGMIAVHQGPLDELEAREAARKAAIEARLLDLQVDPLEVFADAATVKAVIDRVRAVSVDASFQEYQQQAATLQAATLHQLGVKHAAMVKHEAEQAELNRLRAEAAAREAADRAAKEAADREAREALIRKDAENKARLAAEQAAARKAAEEKAKADAALVAEREARLKAEKAAADAKRKAAEAEAKRIADEQAAKAAEEKRAANARHRAKVLKTATEAAMAAVDDYTHPALVAAIMEAAAAGKIPGVTVNF